MTDEPETPAEIVTRSRLVLEMMTEEFTERLAQVFERDEVASRAWALSMLRIMRGDLGLMANDVEGELAEVMPERELNVAGLVIRRSRKKERQVFSSDALLSRVIDVGLKRAEVDLDPEQRHALMSALRDALPITASLGWRRTALDQMVPGWRTEYFSATDAGWSVATQPPK